MARKFNPKKKAAAKKKEIDNRNESIYHNIKPNQWHWVFIMPPWSDAGDIWYEVEKHGLHVCPERLGIRKCVICKEIRKQQKKGNSDFAQEFRLKPVAFLNAIRKEDVTTENPCSKIKVLRLTPRHFEELVDYILDEEIDLTDLEAAIPIGIKKTQKGTNWRTIRYKDLKFGNPIDISNRIDEKEMEEALFDLDTIRAAMPSSDKDMRKSIQEALGGDPDEDDEEEIEDDFDDDDKDDIDDDLDTDDDDEPLKKPSKKSKADAALDDDEDDEDDEEEEKPRRRRRRK